MSNSFAKNQDIKKQLYPREEDMQWKYKRKEDDEYYPDKDDVFNIYSLITKLRNNNATNKELKEKFGSNKEDEIKDFLWSIISKKKSDFKWAEDIKIDVIKGSIYKIKKYFLENNNINDIRGGSVIIDHLNDNVVREVLNDNGFDNSNIIYCGGGNIFLVVPAGKGENICYELERRFTEISLTAMNAFENIECTLKEFAFDYKKIARIVTDKLEERKKIKIYDINPSIKLTKVEITQIIKNKEDIKTKYIVELPNKELSDKDKEQKIVCKYCDIRDARYRITTSEGIKEICPSCYIKHRVGQECKNKFAKEFELETGSNIKEIKSIDELGDEIAVIYGDGNNMGYIVMNIENVFEMMHFSSKTDSITKSSVYKAIDTAFKNKNKSDDIKFEVIALGGDDIFIIVPAEYCFDISKNIVKKFDEEFDNQITMSVGMVISKNSTPVASLFNIAQKSLKNAKKIVKDNNIQEGSIDVIELIGSMHLGSQLERREFPLVYSDYVVFLDNIRKMKKENAQLNTQLYKVDYASKNMTEEEFNLFYYYQESKKKKDTSSINDLITNIYNNCNYCTKYKEINNEENKPTNLEKKFSPYGIGWDDLMMLWNRA